MNRAWEFIICFAHIGIKCTLVFLPFSYIKPFIGLSSSAVCKGTAHLQSPSPDVDNSTKMKSDGYESFACFKGEKRTKAESLCEPHQTSFFLNLLLQKPFPTLPRIFMHEIMFLSNIYLLSMFSTDLHNVHQFSPPKYQLCQFGLWLPSTTERMSNRIMIINCSIVCLEE